MRKRSRYLITVENESRLENIFRISLSPIQIVMLTFGIVLFIMFLGGLILFITPAHSILPGYLKDSERAESEEQHMRLDSLQSANSAIGAYISNFLNILDTDRDIIKEDTPILSDSLSNHTDSIMSTSREELNFAALMRERDKFSISVIAPLAAETLMFTPINDECTFTEDSKSSIKGKVIMSRHSNVASIADGTVIAVSRTLRDGSGASIIIQHAKGFLSRCSRLGTVLVEPGDKVVRGQIIALSSFGNARKNELVNIEMWHNGTPLVPFEYLGDSDSSTTKYPVIDSDVGRGRL